MNQGKLEVVKQEMARVNIDILGVSELRWTGMGEFNSDERDTSMQISHNCMYIYLPSLLSLPPSCIPPL